MSPTPFEVQKETLEDGVCVFTVRGELDLNTTPELEEPLDATLANGEGAPILIDLSACEFIDSTGISVIVRAWQRLGSETEEDSERGLVLCCANDQVSRLLMITGVESSISIHPDRDAALASLRG